MTVGPLLKNVRGYMTTTATDVLQIFTVLYNGTLRGRKKAISLIKVKSASGFL